jgi:hypothetical protein
MPGIESVNIGELRSLRGNIALFLASTKELA